MKNLKSLAQIAVIVFTVMIFGLIVWLSASYFFSLNAQVTQNTQNIQSVVQYINQKTQTPSAPSSTK
jgi:hypothetical protein